MTFDHSCSKEPCGSYHFSTCLLYLTQYRQMWLFCHFIKGVVFVSVSLSILMEDHLFHEKRSQLGTEAQAHLDHFFQSPQVGVQYIGVRQSDSNEIE